MSALAHYIEDEGIATVTISLLRLHSEKIANPRSLWVPFELGRPLGPPKDAEFQTRVLSTALRLLDTGVGPVVLEDFPEEDPTAVELPGWHPSFDLPATADIDFGDQAAVESALRQEIALVAPAYERFVASTHRTTMGPSGLSVAQCADYLTAFLAGAPPVSPDPVVPSVQVLRWAVDDLKVYYLEAMSFGPGIASSRQMQSWFWDRTLAARAILALRLQLLASDDKRSQAIGRMNLVPGVQVQRLGLQ